MSLDTISPTQLDNFIAHPEYQIVDLRAPELFKRGHILGAVNIPYSIYMDEFEILPKNRIYILYCERGGSSLLAARWLDRNGFDVLSLSGGICAYRGRLYV